MTLLHFSVLVLYICLTYVSTVFAVVVSVAYKTPMPIVSVLFLLVIVGVCLQGLLL